MRFRKSSHRKMRVFMMVLAVVTLITVVSIYIAMRNEVFQNKHPSAFVDCDEKHDLVFLKVHKTGSSTIANILQRFGFSRNLNFALPNKEPGEVRYNYFGGIGGTLVKDGIIPSKKDASRYNILFNHVIFNKDSFENVFSNETLYMTMLRYPLSQFLSAALFFQDDRILEIVTKNITAYLENPFRYEPDDPFISFTDNRQALDLGVPDDRVRDEGFIKTYIRMLDKRFDLVLIMEYFDESLVLLKRRMCWTFKNILYKRKNTKIRSVDFNLTMFDRSLHRQWALADYLIYDHFYKKFHNQIKHEPGLMEETHYFKTILFETQKFCKGNNQASFIDIASSRWNEAFRMTSLDCAYMTLNELTFLNKILHDRI